MEVGYDPEKRRWTLDNRDLDMARAGEVFAAPHKTVEDDRFDYDEVRYMTYGHLDGRLVFVAWTWRDGRPRVISMRKANDRERRVHEDALRQGD